MAILFFKLVMHWYHFIITFDVSLVIFLISWEWRYLLRSCQTIILFWSWVLSVEIVWRQLQYSNWRIWFFPWPLDLIGFWFAWNNRISANVYRIIWWSSSSSSSYLFSFTLQSLSKIIRNYIFRYRCTIFLFRWRKR